MLKHKEIIDRLTPEQKMILLTDEKSLFSTEFADDFDVPRLNASSLKELSEEGDVVYPSSSAIANCWNLKLISCMTEDLASRAKKNKVNLVSTPDAKPRANIYSSRMTEDPFYAGMLISTYLTALEESGTASCLSDFSLEPDDAEFADIEPDARILREYYFRPFYTSLTNSECNAINYTPRVLQDKYADVNTKTARHIMKREVAHDGAYICNKITPEEAVSVFGDGAVLCKDGARGYLETAYERYLELKKSAEDGTGSFEELDRAIEVGEALSDERLDEWADRVIEFASKCSSMKNKSQIGNALSESDISKQLCEESIVLLKNKSVLPLKKGTSFAVFGQMASDNNPKTAGFLEKLKELNENEIVQYVGAVYGYKLDTDRSEELQSAAEKLAQKADVLLVFLGRNSERDDKIPETHLTKLPANQLALIDVLSKFGKKIVAVVASDYSVDMSFDIDCDAVLFAPKNATHAADAVFKVLTGAVNPSGKLAASLYDCSDDVARESRIEKSLGKLKIGPFIGYRKYDSIGVGCKYPFGFGLSYTTFKYTDCVVDNSGVKFTVKNTGKIAGSTVVGVYVGKSPSSLLRPKKELKGFTKVPLEPGESKTVIIRLTSKDFYIYDEKINDWSIENGIYELYLGTDVSNIISTLKIEINGKRITPERRRTSDYLQTESNIKAGGYELTPRPTFINKKARKIELIVMLITLAIETVFGFLWYLGLDVGIIMIFTTLLFASSVGMMIYERIKTKNLLKREKENMGIMSENNKQEHTVDQPFDQLFIEEFAEERKVNLEREVSQVKTQSAVKTEDLSAYFKKGLTFDKICDDFTKYATERGVSIENKTARTIISALGASRLVIVNNEDKALLHQLLEIVSTFFGTRSFISNASSFKKVSDMFYTQGNAVDPSRSTEIKACFELANEKIHSMQIAVLEDVNYENVENYFSRFMHYVTSPQFESIITVADINGSERKIKIPSNLWFIMTADAVNNFKAPQFLVEAACVINLKMAAIYPSDYATNAIQPSVHQFVKLVTDAHNEIEIGEDVWKRVDKLEAYVRQRCDYRIGNKQWLRMENFVSVYVACGGNFKDAVDSLVSVKLLVSMINSLNMAEKNENDETDLGQAVANIFGEDDADLCQAVIKQSKLASVNF